MNSQNRIAKTLLFLFSISLTWLGLVSCKPESNLILDPQSGVLVSPIQTSSTFASTLPTPQPTIIDLDGEPTLRPLPTLPPVPTPLYTPVVTPIPVASPPFIPEVVGKTPQPFWIIYWKDNRVWRIDDQGQDNQLLIDPYARLGQWLTDIPEPWRNTDCCRIGVRVAVSPDGQKLALDVVDKLKGRMSDHFTFSIYVFDININDLHLIDEGMQPVWSPDNQHIAYLKGSALWVADLASGQTKKYADGDPAKPEQHVERMMWAPDGRRLEYVLSESMGTNPEFWIVDITDQSSRRIVTDIPQDYYFYCMSWAPDGKNLLCSIPDTYRMYPLPSNLWLLNVENGERKQLTRNVAAGAVWSPNGEWLAVSAEYLFENDAPPYDIGLLSADGSKFLRLTNEQKQNPSDPGNLSAHWSPDGTRLVILRQYSGLMALSLATGQISPIGIDPGFDFAIGGFK